MSTLQPDDRERFDAFGKVAGELMHDMADLLAALDGRIRLALGDVRMGRAPVGELERVANGCGDLRAMLHDVLAMLRNEAISPEVTMTPEIVVDRAIRRSLETCRPVELRMSSALPEGMALPGCESFLYRAMVNLLANAAHHAAAEISVTLDFAEAGDTVVIAVEDDGPGVAPEHRDAFFRQQGGARFGLGSVAWTIARLGGEVRCTAPRRLRGARFEIVLPAPVDTPRAA